MKKEPEENAPVNFSMPQNQADPVICRRILPGGKEETIGRIFQDWDSENGTVIYTAISKDGNELCLPTDDFGTVEDAFNKYARALAEKNKAEEREKFWTEFAGRMEEITTIRQGKRNKTRTQEITL